MTIVSKNNAEHYLWGEVCDGWHFLKSDSLSVIEERVAPQAGEKRHYHQRAQQLFYVLAGIASIEVEGEWHEVHSGEGLAVAPGQKHQLVNKTAEDLRFLVISQPKSHGDRVDV